MTSDDVLARVLGALEAVGIHDMLTGSFASIYYGAPRSTQDIDLVIDPTAGQLRRLFDRSLIPSTTPILARHFRHSIVAPNSA